MKRLLRALLATFCIAVFAPGLPLRPTCGEHETGTVVLTEVARGLNCRSPSCPMAYAGHRTPGRMRLVSPSGRCRAAGRPAGGAYQPGGCWTWCCAGFTTDA